jgi:hypothetical protein
MILLKQLTAPQQVKKFPAFNGTQSFITAFTTLRHLSLSCPIQATPSQQSYLRST